MAGSIRPERAHEFTPLIMAVDRIDASEVQRLLEEGHDPNEKDSYTFSPLHRALKKRELAPDGLRIIELLLEHGADPNSETKSKETPLHEAAFQGHAAALPLLVKHGGRLEKRALYGRTEVHYALNGVAEPEKRLETVQALFKLGAQHAENEYGQNPAHVASVDGLLNELKALIEEHGAPASHKDEHENNYLHSAAAWDQREIAEYLHGKYPEMISERNHAGLTPFDACGDKRRSTARFLKKAASVKN